MIIQIPDDHKDPQDSQLIVVITGTSYQIFDELVNITKRRMIDTEYLYKPCQGTYIQSGGVTTIITPAWKGEKY